MANNVLEILDGDRTGERVAVGDAPVRIGRKAGNDLVLADEKTSGVHCELVTEDGRVVLRDLGSTNGTFLDGKRVTEVVLTPGDVVTVGRIRVRFGDGDEAAPAADDDGEFSLRTLDASRLQKRGSPVGLLVVLLLVLGGGGYWWWTQQGEGPAVRRAVAQRQRDAMVVAGNRLAADVAKCEGDEGWELKAAGLGFRGSADAHTGAGAFSAYVADELADGAPEAGADAATRRGDGFAVMRLAEPLEVFAGRTLTVSAHCRTVGGALVGVRAVVFDDDEASPFRFGTGPRMAALKGWERVEAAVTVPSGCDRLLVEVVAALPGDDAEAAVDDVAVVDGGDPNGFEVKLESGRTAFGCGGAVAVRSADIESPATVLGLAPDRVPAALAPLHGAGLCALSDVGASLSCADADGGFALAVAYLADSGASGLRFVLPAGAGDALMIRAGVDGAFASTGAASEFTAARVLFGSFGTRGMLRFADAAAVRGITGGGVYRISVGADAADVVVNFRAARQEAGSLVRAAQAALAEDRPGDALDTLARVAAEFPMDSAELAAARQLRADILSEQGAALRKLQKELEEADFFDTRGGFERVVDAVDGLRERYGEANVEDLPAARALRGRAEERLAAFGRTMFRAKRERLKMLADAFGDAQQPALQKLVQDYIARHLPEAADEGGGDEGGGDEGGGDEGGRDPRSPR